MSDYEEYKTVDIDIDDYQVQDEQDNQGNDENSGYTSVDELKQQAGKLFKAAGGLASTFGGLAMKKGGELKDKIVDEELQNKAKENLKVVKDNATKQAAKAAEKATVMAEAAKKNLEEKASGKKPDYTATETVYSEPAQELRLRGDRPYQHGCLRR